MSFLKQFLLILAILLWSSSALAQQSMYLSGHIGGLIHPDTKTDISGSGNVNLEYDPGIVLGGAIGVELEGPFRFEGELAYHASTTDDPKWFAAGADLTIGVLSVMLNGYYDFPLESPLRPYVGAGAGFGLINGKAENSSGFTDDDNASALAYQVMTGVRYTLSPKADLTLGYRYFSTTDFDVGVFGFNFDGDFTSHEFMVGALFRFN